ncbi:MAG: nuclear transport factor 2 family protein [Bulleidia sp.]
MTDTFRIEAEIPDEQAVYRVWREICDAMIAKEEKKLKQLFSDDRKFIHMSGKTQTRSEYLNELMNGTLNYFRIGLRNIEFRIDGDHAELTASSCLKSEVCDLTGTFPMHTSAKFTKIGDAWI